MLSIPESSQWYVDQPDVIYKMKGLCYQDLHGSPPVLPADVLHKLFTCGCPSYILVLKINKELLPTKKALRLLYAGFWITPMKPHPPPHPPTPNYKDSCTILNLGFQDLLLTELKNLKALTFSNLQGHYFCDKSLTVKMHCTYPIHTSKI